MTAHDVHRGGGTGHHPPTSVRPDGAGREALPRRAAGGALRRGPGREHERTAIQSLGVDGGPGPPLRSEVVRPRARPDDVPGPYVLLPHVCLESRGWAALADARAAPHRALRDGQRERYLVTSDADRLAEDLPRG